MLLANGGDPADRNDYEHDAGTAGYGEDINWMTTNAGGAHTTGWYKVDLGQAYKLYEAHLFNFNPNAAGASGNEDRGVKEANIYYLDAASDPNSNNNGNDAAFDST
jgi:hypothetical protein